MTFKRWPVGSREQSAIRAALQTRAGIADIAGITSIHVSTDEDVYNHLVQQCADPWNPISRETADHSLPCIVATAILDGAIGVDTFESAKVLDPNRRILLNAGLTVEASPALSGGMATGFLTRVEITDASGRVAIGEAKAAPGHVLQPLDDSDFEQKRNEAGGYADNFDEPEGLFKVPRVPSYRGLIFASFNTGVQPLEQYLGRAKKLIDRKFGRSPSSRIVMRGKPFVMRYQGNWKFQAENIVDAYHFLHTHKGFVALQAKYGNTTGDFGVHKGGSVKAMRALRFKGASWSLPNGHAQIENPAADPDSFLNGEFASYYQSLLERDGADEFAAVVGKMTGTIFPNLGLIHQQLRTWRPIAPDLTEVTIHLYDLVDAPAEINDGMMRSQERFYGPAGHGMVDDIDIFARNQQGLAGSAVEWLIVERGLSTDERLETGEYKGLPASEAPQRALWREWKKLMAAG